MNYEQAAAKYVELRTEVDRINKAAKAKVAELNKVMLDIENWFTLKADEDGLKTIPTLAGTAYWSTVSSASVAEPTVFKQYVIDNGAWDLIETRAAKLSVKSFVESNGQPPPGVNFSSVKVFNLRANHKETT
jgi:hypothetical protein